MNRDAISERRKVVGILFGLGLSCQDVANALDETVSAILNDVKKLGGAESFPNRQASTPPTSEHRNKVFQDALAFYINDPLVRGRNSNQVIKKSLAKFLGLKDIATFANGVSVAMSNLMMPQYPPDRRNYYILLRAIFGESCRASEGSMTDISNNNALSSYLHEIRENKTPMPNRANFGSEIAKFLVAENRQRIAPIWNNDNMYDEILAWVSPPLLTPRETKVIRMRFGIGEYNRCHNSEELTLEFFGRVRQLEAKALRKLRVSSSTSKFLRYMRCQQITVTE